MISFDDTGYSILFLLSAVPGRKGGKEPGGGKKKSQKNRPGLFRRDRHSTQKKKGTMIKNAIKYVLIELRSSRITTLLFSFFYTFFSSSSSYTQVVPAATISFPLFFFFLRTPLLFLFLLLLSSLSLLPLLSPLHNILNLIRIATGGGYQRLVR